MGLAQQFLAGRSPHRVLVGDEPLDTKFSEALERAVTARAKNEFGLVENAMDEEGALARTQNAYRQQRQAKLEEAQYKEAIEQAAVKAAATDAILGDIFQTKQERYDRGLDNLERYNKVQTDDSIADMINTQLNREKIASMISNATTAQELEEARKLLNEYKNQKLRLNSSNIKTETTTAD
tara:strand:+ start:208 stop:750 length:543 start_codon:yes stop_codon:yes gene_type:complete